MALKPEIEKSSKVYKSLLTEPIIKEDKPSSSFDTSFDTSFIADLTPLSKLAQGAIGKFNLQKITTQAEETRKREQALFDKIDNLYQSEQDPNRKEQYKKILTSFKFSTSNNQEIERQKAKIPSNSQMVFSAGEGILGAGLAGFGLAGKITKSGRLGLKSEEEVVKHVAENFVKKQATQQQYKQLFGKGAKAAEIAIETGKQAGIGATLNTLAAGAMNKELNTDTIIDATTTGALFGGGAYLGLTMAGKGIGKGLDYAGKGATKAGQSIETKLKSVAGERFKGDIANANDQFNSQFRENYGIKQKAAEKALNVIDESKRLIQRVLDRYAPLNDIENKVLEKFGILKEGQDIYKQARLANSIADFKTNENIAKLETKLNDIVKGSKKPEELKKSIRNAMAALDELDRIQADPEYIITRFDENGNKVVFKGNEAAQISIASYQDILVRSENPQAIKAGMEEITNFTRRQLQERVDAGIMTKEEAQAIIENHKSYIPTNRFQDSDNRLFSSYKDNYNITDRDIDKAFGSLKDTIDPYESMAMREKALNRMIEHNKMLKNLAELQEETGVVPGMRALTTAKQQIAKESIIKTLTETKDKKKTISKEILRKAKANKGIGEDVSILEKKLSEADMNFQKLVTKSKEANVDYGDLEELMQRGQTIDKEIDDLLTFKGENTEDINALRNEVKTLNEERKTLWKEAQSLGKKAKDTEEQTISFYRDGKKEEWVVPSDVAESFKGLQSLPMNKLMEASSFVTDIFRKGTTILNPEFAIPNMFRDRQTAITLSDGLIEKYSKKYGLAKDGVVSTPENIKELYARSGGLGAEIFKEGNDKVITEVGNKSGMWKVVDSANPLNVFKAVNEQVESSTRLMVFKKALDAGLDEKTAALVARDASVDFAKMGTWMRHVNQVVPFLNARVQAFSNLGEGYFKNPEAFSRAMTMTAIYPQMALYQNNRRYDSYQNISQWMKDNYWIIMTGEMDSTDPKTGNPIKVAQFISIPKGDGQKLVANPLEYFLAQNDAKDMRKVDEMLGDVLGSLSPLDLERFNKVDPATAFVSQLGPVASTIAGLATNIDPFTGYSIMPDNKTSQGRKYTDYNNRALVDALKPLNISPAQTQFFVESLTGGLGKSTLQGIDLMYGVAKGDTIADKKLTQTPFGAITQIPIARRVVREDSGKRSQLMEKQADVLKEGIEEGANRAFDLKEDVKTFLKNTDGKTSQEKKAEFKRIFKDKLLSGEYSEDKLEEQLNNSILDKITKMENISPDTPVSGRAAVIDFRIDYMEKNGSSKEEIAKYLGELEAKKILTDSVLEEMIRIKRNRKLKNKKGS